MALASCSGKLPKIALLDLSALLPSRPDATPVPTFALYDGAISARVATGYCADPAASRPSQGFAIFASCVSLGVEDAAPVIPAIITVQVAGLDTAAVSADPTAFMAVVSGDAGPSLLSRAGDAASITMGATDVVDDFVTVTFADAAPSDIAGLQPEQWRGFGDLAGRLVTLSVRGFLEQRLSDARGTAILVRTIAGFDAANTSNIPTDP